MAILEIAEAVKALSGPEQEELFGLLRKEDAVFQEYLEDLLDSAIIRHALDQAKPDDFLPWEQVKPQLNALHGCPP